jgi:hypothetical protein
VINHISATMSIKTKSIISKYILFSSFDKTNTITYKCSCYSNCTYNIKICNRFGGFRKIAHVELFSRLICKEIVTNSQHSLTQCLLKPGSLKFPN